MRVLNGPMVRANRNTPTIWVVSSEEEHLLDAEGAASSSLARPTIRNTECLLTYEKGALFV